MLISAFVIHAVNLIFLIDSLAYFIGYILFLQELEDAVNDVHYQRPAQVAVLRYKFVVGYIVFEILFKKILLNYSEIFNASHMEEADELLPGDEAFSTSIEMTENSFVG